MTNYSRLARIMKKYTMLILPAFIWPGNSDAQIIYTDISPNYEGDGNDIFDLDLNNDGIFDFEFIRETILTTDYWADSFSKWSYEYQKHSLVVVGLNSNAIIVENGKPDTLNLGDCIDPGLAVDNGGLMYTNIIMQSTWENYDGTYWIETEKENDGSWFKAKNKYLGLIIDINGENHFGWVRLSCHATDPHYLIKDYAFNTVANEPAVAGDTISCLYLSTDFDNSALKGIEWFIENRILNITISDTELKGAALLIYDLHGRQNISSLIYDDIQQVDLSSFSSGCYLLFFKHNNLNSSFKFFLN